eukprot:scaffold149115_cov41-Attheya_sp.AAC.2
MAQNSTAHGRAAIPLVLNKKNKKRYTSWDESFKELVDFKKINGHANVPTRVRPLGRWVSNQRRQYQLLQEGKGSQLTIDKFEILESIGFEFKYHPTTPWDQRFQELVDFKKINGHANVPQSCRPLGPWVHNQRTRYRCYTLTSDKREKFESIGFEFKCRHTTRFTELPCEEEVECENMAQNSTAHGRAAIPLVSFKKSKKRYTSWDERFKDLVDFKKINEHTNVPTKFALGKWASTQRTQNGLLQKGKDSLLTIDKREKLKSIGFVFKLRPTFLSWDQRFQDLVEYNKINGHTNVPTHSGPLGTWITHQRTQYGLLQAGKDSRLTIDKREKLESIGFEFK